MSNASSGLRIIIIIIITSKVTAPQDAHRRLVLQVYLGSNTLEFSLYIGEIFVVDFRKSKFTATWLQELCGFLKSFNLKGGARYQLINREQQGTPSPAYTRALRA